METFPAKTSPDGRIIAFEVENLYIGPQAVARLLRQVRSVSGVRPRRMFSRNSEIHVRFKHGGHACIVWEPYGDSSRYWIGPENPESFPLDMTDVQSAFGNYKPPIHRAILGNLLSLNFLRR
jgi:hypothetical protein